MDQTFLRRAEQYRAAPVRGTARPRDIVTFCEDSTAYLQYTVRREGELSFPIPLEYGKPVILDFGDHTVGYLHYALNHTVQIADSPVCLRFSLGEVPCDTELTRGSYHGVLGDGWVQTFDDTQVFLPCKAKEDRRFAFRYVKIERMDRAGFGVELTDLFCETVSAVKAEDCRPAVIMDERMRRIDEMACKTLLHCEQDVFEDGPKRDRRMWTGDLRLQALTDSVTFCNADLVRRSLYLFAAHRIDDRRVAPYVFPDSPPYHDDWFFADYSLFFVCCLYDHTMAYDDRQTAEELFSVARDQIALTWESFSAENKTLGNTYFADWCDGLQKEICALGIFSYTLNRYEKLAYYLGVSVPEVVEMQKAVQTALWSYYDAETGLFRAKDGQISYHSQIWAILSGALDETQGKALFAALSARDDALTCVAPYMYHYYVEALFACGLREQARELILQYWGKMADVGLDCCPEVFVPTDPVRTPYRDHRINSFCHAWSCTASYWIRKYHL